MAASRISQLSLLFFLFGLAFSSYLPVYSPVGYFFGAGFFLLLIIVRVRRKHRLYSCLGLLLLTFHLGFFYCILWRQYRLAAYPYGQLINFSGIIVEPPDLRQNKTFLTLEPNRSLGKNFFGIAKKGRVQVRVPRYPSYKYGESLEIEGLIEKAEPFNNFNYPLYLERYGIYGIISRPQKVIPLGKPVPFSIWKLLFSLRSRVEKNIQEALPEPESSFLSGILLGSKRAIPSDIQENLKQTGTSHLVAISGANITILLSILGKIIPGRSLKHKFFLTCLSSVFITFLTGASASVRRGATMACLGSYIKMRSRRALATPLILCGLTILILGNPLLLAADPGFQLSFSAFAGLVYLGRPLTHYLMQAQFGKSWPEWIQSSFAETLAATLGTLPLSLGIFGQFSWLGLLVNPLVLWLITPITFLGLCLIAVSKILLLKYLIGLSTWWLLHTALAIINLSARLPFGVYVKPISQAQIIPIYLTGWLIIRYRQPVLKLISEKLNANA